MGRRHRGLVIAALAGVLVPLAVAGAPATAAPPTCVAQRHLPAVPSGSGGSQDALVDEAARLAALGRLDAAARLYDVALDLDAPDARAGAGLAYVQAARTEAERIADSAVRMRTAGAPGAATCFRRALALDAGNATALAGRDAAPSVAPTAAETAASRWDDVYAHWIEPAGRALLPLVALLAVLLVAARLVTPVAAPATARAWPEPWRRAAWWAGLALLALVALEWTGVLPWVPGMAGWLEWLRGPLLLVLLAAAVVVFWAGRRLSTVGTDGRRIATNHGGQVAAVVVFAGLLLLARVLPANAWPVVLTGSVALLGLALHACGRGHALRLQVQVKNGETADPAATAYILGRLQELGTAPPRGIKSPQQVDVTDLPSTALSSLPAGKVAAALSSALNLVLPSVPWRATIEAADTGRLVVTVTRNGSVADTVIVDGTRFRPASARADVAAAGGHARDDEALLTAAAAVVLTLLAQRHTTLRTGLCGASRWESVAAQVVATGPPGVGDDGLLRRELLAFAVQRDPRNLLAWAAYLQVLGEDAVELPELEADAWRLQELKGQVDREGADDEQGFYALRLRLMHTLTAAWLNLCLAQLATGGHWEAAWWQADEALVALAALLAAPSSSAGLEPFVGEFRDVVEPLRAGLDACPARSRPRPPVVQVAVAEPVSLFVHYDRACTLAVTGRDDPTGWDEALKELFLAVGMSRYQALARVDPALAALRDPRESGERSARFWALVAATDPAFTDLAPFGERGAALRGLGISGPRDLIAVTADDGAALAASLEVAAGVVARWRAVALLAEPRPGRARWLDTRELGILVSLGIRSDADLVAALAEVDGDPPVAVLPGRVLAQVTELGLRPPDDAELVELLTLRSPGPDGPPSGTA